MGSTFLFTMSTWVFFRSESINGAFNYLFKMILEIRLKIEDKQATQKEKIFVKEFSYKNLENKFDLSEYETNIENNLINQIVEEMIIYLSV